MRAERFACGEPVRTFPNGGANDWKPPRFPALEDTEEFDVLEFSAYFSVFCKPF